MVYIPITKSFKYSPNKLENNYEIQIILAPQYKAWTKMTTFSNKIQQSLEKIEIKCYENGKQKPKIQ